jgi:hypothetical protein
MKISEKYKSNPFVSLTAKIEKSKAMNGVINIGYPGPFHKFISGNGGE